MSSQLPWKHRVLLRLSTVVVGACCRSDFTLNRWLAGILDRKIPPSSKPLHGDSLTLPVIFYYHGGGFAFSYADSALSHITAHRFAKQLRAVIISVNYRLAPEFRFPCQYDDGFDALKFIDGIGDGVLPARADLGRCFILGESAGGNLGHHVAVRASEYEFKRVKVVGLIASQPFFGGEERTESEIRLRNQAPLSLGISDWFWKAFLPEGEDRNHWAVNVFGPNGRDVSRLEKFPATVIFAGGLDLLVDRQRLYYEGLKRMGKDVKLVEFPSAVHGFFIFKDLPEYSSMIEEMMDFIAKPIVSHPLM